MTRDEVIEIWGKANGWSIKEFNITITELEHFAQLIAEREREECAKVCDGLHHTWRWDNEPDSDSGPRDCAKAIRARGNK